MKSKRGQKKVEVNRILVLSVYVAGMTQITVRQFCDKAGIVCPTKSTLISLWIKVKDNVLAISKEQLLENLRKHNQACRQLQNYKGDIKLLI
jgi:hypothetical protein